jgi:phosphatidylserine decarboxylase
MPSARQESRRFLLPLRIVGLLLVAAAFVWPAFRPPAVLLVLLNLLLLGFVRFFFRDPERAVPTDPTLIVSAADGLVVSVDEMDEPDFQLGVRRRIAVFLRTSHKPGEFLDVRHPECSTRNEALSWLVETAHGPVAVRQIAGLVARRIVAWTKEGATLSRGERFGMIRFGSRTEVFLPVTCQVLVKPGDRVQGALTPIARWNP